jgi:hypothetical protein
MREEEAATAAAATSNVDSPQLAISNRPFLSENDIRVFPQS